MFFKYISISEICELWSRQTTFFVNNKVFAVSRNSRFPITVDKQNNCDNKVVAVSRNSTTKILRTRESRQPAEIDFFPAITLLSTVIPMNIAPVVKGIIWYTRISRILCPRTDLSSAEILSSTIFRSANAIYTSERMFLYSPSTPHFISKPPCTVFYLLFHPTNRAGPFFYLRCKRLVPSLRDPTYSI